MARDILQGFISILGARVLILLLGLLLTPVLVRILGSSSYGDYAFIVSLLGITMIIVNAGIFDGTRKFMAENRPNQNWGEYVFGFYLRKAVVLAGLAAIIYGLFAWIGLAGQLFGPGYDLYLYLLGLAIIGRQAHSVSRGGLMGLGFEEKSEPLHGLKQVVFWTVGLSLAYVGYGVVGMLIGHIVASFTVAVLAFGILFKRMIPQAVLEGPPKDFPRKELLSFNTWSIVFILLTASLFHVDVLLLRPMVGNQETGYYKAALVVAEFLWFVPNAIHTALLPSSSEIWSEENTDRITSLISQVTRFNLALILLMAIGLSSLSHDFVSIYFGAEFESTVYPLLVLLPGVIGFAVARPIFAVGQGKGELRILILATGASALLNLVLNILLIPRFGIVGAGVATSIGYGSMAVFHIKASFRIGFNPVADLRLMRIIKVCLLASPFIYGIAYFIESSILSLLFAPPIGLIVYGSLSIYFGVITIKEISDILTNFPDPIPGLIEDKLRPFK